MIKQISFKISDYCHHMIMGLFLFALVSMVSAQPVQTANKPERVKWFQDLAFGMFIHWNVDVSLGGIISQSMVGASDDYIKRYVAELPSYFNPKKFDPDGWATLARLAGMKYVVFTAKHHSGFCMFDTETTSFNVTNTPYKKDIMREIIDAFRKQGLAIGLYFSPEDFLFFSENDIPVGRLQHPQHYPKNNPELMEYDKKQVRELLTNYGKIDMLFFDGPCEGLKEYAWGLNPDLVITRGEMETPEQKVPDKALPRPWEACYTMGTEWSYKATNDPQKTGGRIIDMLVEIRAKGGNLLLNVGPKPDGEIQIEQENLLREVALWNFVNHESVYDVKPAPIVRYKNVWFTQSNDGKSIYAFITRSGPDDWAYRERREFLLPMIEGSKETEVSVLGYKSELVVYRKGFDAAVRVASTGIGLAISAVNGQRLYTDNKWPNTIVLKIDKAKFKPELGKPISEAKMDGAQ